MQTPSLGRIIIVRTDPEDHSGATEAPAVITRVWNEQADGSHLVNVQVLHDNGGVQPRTSLSLFEDQAAADEAKPDGTHVGWWPPKV
jgi:hypothetical protein